MSMRTTKCRACGREIVFLRTEKGKFIPVVAESVSSDNEIFDHKKHTTHFADCRAAETFRKKESKNDKK